MSQAIQSERMGVTTEATARDADDAIPATAALREILAVWRPYRVRLFFGALLSILALLCGYALMGAAGGRLSGLAVGVGVGYVLMRISGLGRVALRYMERLFAHDAMFRALAAVRVWFYRQLAGGAAAGIGFRRAGDLLSRLVSDIETLDNLYLRLAIPLAGALSTGPVLAVIGWHASPELGAALLVLFLCCAVLLPLIAATLSKHTAAEISEAESALRVSALDLATGLREVRAFGAETLMVNRIERGQDVLYGVQQRQSRRMAMAGVLSSLCGQIAILAVLAAMVGVGSWHVSAIGGTTLLFVVIAAFEAIAGLTRAGLLARRVGHAAQRIVDVAHESQATSSGTVIPNLQGAIALDNVSFRWNAESTLVFEHLNLTINHGERVALLGPSGSGKSSLAALLLKVAAPSDGYIRFDGQDSATLDTVALRRQIGWLSQTTHLFDDTIRNNLLLSRADATEAQMWDSLDRAEIGDFIRSLSDGLDAWVGEGGTKLSGGQGRRVALARTLLSDAPLLILDEPATGLDSDTERAFLKTLNETTEGRTVLLIAHRLTGVERLDRVWRLEGGQAVAAPI